MKKTADKEEQLVYSCSQDNTEDINIIIYIYTIPAAVHTAALGYSIHNTRLASLAISLGARLMSGVLASPRRVYPCDGPKDRRDNTVSLLIITPRGCRDDAPRDPRETKTIA